MFKTAAMASDDFNSASGPSRTVGQHMVGDLQPRVCGLFMTSSVSSSFVALLEAPLGCLDSSVLRAFSVAEVFIVVLLCFVGGFGG